MRPEQLEIERLRRENAKLKAERHILKKAVVAYFGNRPTQFLGQDDDGARDRVTHCRGVVSGKW